jgi:hypothetical protein
LAASLKAASYDAFKSGLQQHLYQPHLRRRSWGSCRCCVLHMKSGDFNHSAAIPAASVKLPACTECMLRSLQLFEYDQASDLTPAGCGSEGVAQARPAAASTAAVGDRSKGHLFALQGVSSYCVQYRHHRHTLWYWWYH